MILVKIETGKWEKSTNIQKHKSNFRKQVPQWILIHQWCLPHPGNHKKKRKKKVYKDYRTAGRVKINQEGKLEPHPLSPRTMTLSKVLLGAAMVNKAKLVFRRKEGKRRRNCYGLERLKVVGQGRVHVKFVDDINGNL